MVTDRDAGQHSVVRDPEGKGTGAMAVEGSWRGTLLFFLANVLFSAGLFFHAFLYNFYLQGLGHGEGVMGVAAAAISAGGVLALIPAGLAVDRWGVRNT
jgi:MFS family permease